MRIRQHARRWLKSLGYDIVPYTPDEHPLARRKRILDRFGVEVVLDVGANTGQYGRMLRTIGYRGRILSFEPLADAWKRLAAHARDDRLWEVFHFALGHVSGRSVLNVAGNSYSSSLLDLLPAHEQAAPQSHYVGTEEIELKTLDSIFDTLSVSGSGILLKLDTQGFEKNVLEGAVKSLRHIDTLELEMSIVPLYRDELPFPAMYERLCREGYGLVCIEPEFADERTGQLLQVEATFHRF